jgi:putative MATE family efflux protein
MLGEKMKKIDLTEGKVLSVITSLALPIMGSSFLQFANNLIDMLWVGRLGSDAVASIGSASFFVLLGYSINSIVVIGTGIKVAHAVGEKNETAVKKYINAGLILNLVLAIIYSLILIIFGHQLIGFLNLNNQTVEKDAYLFLAISGPIVFFTFYNFLYARIQGSFGNNKTALKINSIGIIINIILDPVFIFGFKLGVSGAAIATLIATIIMFLLFKIKSRGTIEYKKKLGIDYLKVKEILRLGFPMAFQRVLFTLINIILAKIVAQYGSNAIAAQKIGVQIESISFMIIGGLNGAIASFTGQNFGALKYNRIKQGYKATIVIGIIYSGTIAIMFWIFPEPLTRIFVSEQETVNIAMSYLQIIAFSMVFSAIEMVTNGLFTGVGKPKIPSIISIIFTALRIPIALILTKYIGAEGIWLSTAITSILKGVISYLMYLFENRKGFLDASTV